MKRMKMMMMMMMKKKKSRHVYIANTDRDCGLLQDRPVLLSGRMPPDKQNRICPDYNHNVIESQRA